MNSVVRQELMMHLNNYAQRNVRFFPKDYSVKSILHEGVHSTLFLCNDFSNDSEVVIKQFNSEGKSGYLREMASAFGLVHPNLAHCLDTFYSGNGQACMVYEYISGGNLQQCLKDKGSFDLRSTINCLRDILQALIHLHNLDRVHCDIKPENIFLRPTNDGDHEYVLGDLGAACFIREAREGRHSTGSPAYIAPERLYDRFSYNSDLYSLGILAFELCTGFRPFNGSVEDVSRAHLSITPPISEIPNSMLADFIESLLEKDPSKRIQNPEMALSLLNMQHKSQSIEALNSIELDRSTDISLKSSRPGLIVNLAESWQVKLRLTEQPQRYINLHSQGRPLLGLAYQNHIQLIDPQLSERPIKTLLNSGSAQVVGPSQILYSTPSRIIHYEINHQRSTPIKTDCSGLIGFYSESERLYWRNKNARYYCDLRNNSEYCFHKAGYFLKSQASILVDGTFFTSDGPTNQQITWRSQDAEPLKTWNLDGPILAMTHQESTLIAVTMDHVEKQYAIWQIEPDCESIKRLLLKDVKLFSVAFGNVFWLNNDSSLYQYDTRNKTSVFINTLPATDMFGFTADHRYLFALITDKDEHTILSIWTSVTEELTKK